MLFRSAGVRILRRAALRRAAFRAASARGRALVLVYHRVSPAGAAPHEVVPSLRVTLLRRQLELLGDVGEIVPLAALLGPPAARRRVRFAVTFDDDDPSHAGHALSVLRMLGIPATFFLSGRSLHGLGPYWWVALEQAISAHGLQETRRRLGLPGDTPADLAAACERSGGAELAQRLADPGTVPDTSLPQAGELRTLAQAGMTIGFHTLRHSVLTGLPDESLARAMREGRDELAAATGAPVDFLAYPHGQANRRVARAARAAGYRAAFRTGGRPVGPRSDAFFLGRWEPGALAPDEMLAHAALRLNYPPGVPRE